MSVEEGFGSVELPLVEPRKKRGLFSRGPRRDDNFEVVVAIERTKAMALQRIAVALEKIAGKEV